MSAPKRNPLIPRVSLLYRHIRSPSQPSEIYSNSNPPPIDFTPPPPPHTRALKSQRLFAVGEQSEHKLARVCGGGNFIIFELHSNSVRRAIIHDFGLRHTHTHPYIKFDVYMTSLTLIPFFFIYALASAIV